MKTGAQLLAEVKERIKQVTPQEVLDMQKRGEKVTLLDVRDLHEGIEVRMLQRCLAGSESGRRVLTPPDGHHLAQSCGVLNCDRRKHPVSRGSEARHRFLQASFEPSS